MTIENDSKLVDDIFKVKIVLADKRVGQRTQISKNLKLELIDSIVEIIKNLKLKFNSFSYFHLRHILSKINNQLEVKRQLTLLIKDSIKSVDFEYVKFLFNVIFDSLDSIGSRGIKPIQRRYHTRFEDFKNSIFKDKEKFQNRFKTTQKFKNVYIQKLAEDIVNGKKSQKSFENLMDPYIQALKEYYRNNFTKGPYHGLKPIFYQEVIGKSFVQKFLNLSPVTLKKIFLNKSLENIDIYELTRQMEAINMNNEISIFIVYSLIMNEGSESSEIARKAGTNTNFILKYGKILSKLINPKTKTYYIDYNKRFPNKHGGSYWALIPSRISLTGYSLQIPNNEKLYLIQEIDKVIDSLVKKYDYPYYIKEFLRNNSQKSQDYNNIITKLLKLSKLHRKLTFSDCFGLFYIMLEIYDYISAKSQTQIAKEFVKSRGLTNILAKLIIRDPIDYKNRFLSTKDIQNKVIEFANDVISGRLKEDHVNNIDSFEFQQVVEAYRKYRVKLDTDRLINKGYPSIGSSSFKMRVFSFKRKNLFDRYFLGSKFIEWSESLTELLLKEIIKFTTKSNLKREILIMCGKINQNHEILKYIIYLILKSNDSLAKIAKKSGKNASNVRRIGNILDLSICPITKTYYIKSYEERFLK